MMQQNENLHKKRFGQYFSGKHVADMLYSMLPKERVWETVIDPMAGQGDMLVSVLEHAKNTPKVFGVEIDEQVAEICSKRVPLANIICGDAFNCADIINEGFDLVITNPPYVRYQLQNINNDIMPSSQSIRENLIQTIENISYLKEAEKQLFLTLAKNYSGLADMAVPSWLLCASLVKEGGYIAMVVPDSWLNRDYAAPIQYLLMKLFDIEIIVRDTYSTWFSEALVKTCLVVAKRVAIQSISQAEKNVTRVIEAEREHSQSTLTIFHSICHTKESKNWISLEDNSFIAHRTMIPFELLKIIGQDNQVSFTSLVKMGIECGQGIRTGANQFFYVNIDKEDDDYYYVHSNKWDSSGRAYHFLKTDIIKTFRNRGEVEGIIVRLNKLSTGLVYPTGSINEDLRDYIIAADGFRDEKGMAFKEYSAVKPNEKKVGNSIVREWYRLPKLTNRHLPDLCITRLSSRTPECLFVEQNSDSVIAVDANMVTLWGNDRKTVYLMMAVLNSTWSKLFLELTCTVMGGGALKIESSHLKRLLIPTLNQQQLSKLEKLGTELIRKGAMSEIIQDEIDEIINSAFGEEGLTQEMRRMLKQKYMERTNNNG